MSEALDCQLSARTAERFSVIHKPSLSLIRPALMGEPIAEYVRRSYTAADAIASAR